MDQASASPAASCACNPAEPRTSSSCSRSAGQSQTAAPPPARSDPQCEPHAVPSNSRPRPSSPALCRLKAKRLPAAGFLLRRDRESGRFSEGLLLRRLHHPESLAIRERLAASDRSNTLWQRDLSLSYERIGDVQVDQGKLDDALKSYRDCLVIRE